MADMRVGITMKANRIHAFGGPEVILFEDLPRPAPGPAEVLVRVHAAGVGREMPGCAPGAARSRSHCRSRWARIWPATVEAAGSSDSPFAAGDEVFGVTNPRFTGSNAEYALAFNHMLAHKPRRRDFFESAAVPVVAVTARQMLFRYAQVQTGDRVLIHGGTMT